MIHCFSLQHSSMTCLTVMSTIELSLWWHCKSSNAVMIIFHGNSLGLGFPWWWYVSSFTGCPYFFQKIVGIPETWSLLSFARSCTVVILPATCVRVSPMLFAVVISASQEWRCGQFNSTWSWLVLSSPSLVSSACFLIDFFTHAKVGWSTFQQVSHFMSIPLLNSGVVPVRLGTDPSDLHPAQGYASYALQLYHYHTSFAGFTGSKHELSSLTFLTLKLW